MGRGCVMGGGKVSNKNIGKANEERGWDQIEMKRKKKTGDSVWYSMQNSQDDESGSGRNSYNS